MKKRAWVPVIALAVVCSAMILAPSPTPLVKDDVATGRARIVSTDDTQLSLTGLIEYGTQHLCVELLDGSHAGKIFHAENELRAQMELDKKFSPGDIAVITLPHAEHAEGEAVPVAETLVARDHWRIGWLSVLFGGFVLLLVVFGGWTGVKALFSFVFSCLAVWKLLIPLCLGGYHAGLTTFFTVAVLTAVIMYLVAGATRKGVVAFLGAMLGVGASLALAEFFARVLHVNGATMPFVQSLLYSGYANLNLLDVFTGSVILASSGAVMDLAMDIASSCEEVVRHRSNISRRELFSSGIRVGRSVVGTMTTTLLLAYSGGYLTLLMVFAAQGTHPLAFVNSTIVSAELVKTLVGSFGLVLVAPFTAFVASIAMTRRGSVDRRRTK